MRLLREPQFFISKKIPVARLAVDVQADDVGLSQHFFKRASFGVAASHVGHFAEDDAHAMGFGEVGKLRADPPITNDPEDEAAHFVSTGRGLVPLAAVHFGAGREDAARA